MSWAVLRGMPQSAATSASSLPQASLSFKSAAEAVLEWRITGARGLEGPEPKPPNLLKDIRGLLQALSRGNEVLSDTSIPRALIWLRQVGIWPVQALFRGCRMRENRGVFEQMEVHTD